jgi:hypothetical protein
MACFALIMLLWEKKIPYYLNDKKNIVSFVLFTAVFALIFINIYAPFGVDKWMNVTDFQLFLYSSVVILIGMLVIVISRMLMYLFTRKKAVRYGEYVLWIIGEILSLAFVYALIQKLIIGVNKDFMVIMRNTVRITAFIILLPYVIYWLYLSFKDKYALLEKMSLAGRNPVNDLKWRNNPAGINSMITFRDEKGVLRFSIKPEDLLYLESADNYVIIHYLENEKQVKYMIRNTLKRIESEFTNSELVRCHRSYIVNLLNVKVIRKEKEGLMINFESPSHVTLPVSKTYLDGFIRKLSNAAKADPEI